jgi:hypothetical protein
MNAYQNEAALGCVGAHRGPEKSWSKAFLHWRTWLGKRFRMFILRRVQRHYARAVDREWDETASRQLDCATYLRETEESAEVEG